MDFLQFQDYLCHNHENVALIFQPYPLKIVIQAIEIDADSHLSLCLFHSLSHLHAGPGRSLPCFLLQGKHPYFAISFPY